MRYFKRSVKKIARNWRVGHDSVSADVRYYLKYVKNLSQINNNRLIFKFFKLNVGEKAKPSQIETLLKNSEFYIETKYVFMVLRSCNPCRLYRLVVTFCLGRILLDPSTHHLLL